MHLNEVISSIKMAGSVGLDETGRLLLGYDCTTPTSCAEWGVIDSPMENLALYTRLMKYGHFQTDPLEEDIWAHGDPAAGTQYNPALDPTLDWQKFQASVRHLLPAVEGTYVPESLQPEDFVAAGAALGGAANKTGKVTVDLVQYMNRILKITKDTGATLATADTRPALVRDCWSDGRADPPQPGESETPVDPIYDSCSVTAADWVTTPNYGLFPDVQELFVDFSAVNYDRTASLNTFVNIVGPLPDDGNPGTPLPWVEVNGVPILGWLEFRNGAPPAGGVPGIAGFVAASSDALRSVEFVHNYEIPEDLGWEFVPSGIDVKIKVKSK
jgi:hypothetical protein